jgi:hypothetical protein
MLRVGTWNIRWFPRGCPSNQACPDKTTDLPWLACTIAWMHVDMLALQEILATPDGEFSLNALRIELERLTGGSWHVDLHACGAPSTQHVGFLWKGARVALARAYRCVGIERGRDQPHGQCLRREPAPGPIRVRQDPDRRGLPSPVRAF